MHQTYFDTLQQTPEDIRALYLRGLELFQKGEPLKAIEHWKLTALQILPEQTSRPIEV